MRYSLTTLACAALAATTLAAPVMEKRAREVLIFTDYTTIVVTKTILTGEPQSTQAVQAEWAKGGYGGHQSGPVYTTRTTTLKPITISTRTTTLPAVTSTVQPVTSTAEPVTIETSAPVQVPGTTTVVQEVTSSPSPVTVITTIQKETPTPTPTTVAPVITTSTYVAPVETTTAAATTVTSAAAPADTWAAAVLKAHNTRRALHGAPDLIWDATMASYASGISAKCVFEHSGGPYGENLAAGYPTPDSAIEAWYAENTSYNYAAGLFSEATGHFTQLVWKGATKVGCGIATCGTSTTPGDMLTCEYDTGNVVGYFVENVLPLV